MRRRRPRESTWTLTATEAQRHKLLNLGYEPEADFLTMTRAEATARIETLLRRRMGDPHRQP